MLCVVKRKKERKRTKNGHSKIVQRHKLLFNILTTSSLCRVQQYMLMSITYYTLWNNIQDSISQSKNHVMQTTSTKHIQQSLEFESEWVESRARPIVGKHIANKMHAKNSFQEKWNGMESRVFVWEMRKGVLLSGIAHCLSATEWILVHTFLLPATHIFFISLSPPFRMPRTGIAKRIIWIVMAIAQTFTYFNVVHGIFLMNYCAPLDLMNAMPANKPASQQANKWTTLYAVAFVPCAFNT